MRKLRGKNDVAGGVCVNCVERMTLQEECA